MTKVKNLVSDGCEKMVGWEKGVHASLERIFGIPLGRIICFFHHLEKSFEVILLLYSGNTTSPGSYSRGVGKEIMGDLHKLPVKDFEVLPNAYLLTLIDSTSEEVFRSLSNDHQVLIKLLRMVITGDLDKRFIFMKIGPVVTSRFTTSEARTLRLYISEENPSFPLKRVVNFLVYVWTPVFLLTKKMNKLEATPRMLLMEVMLIQKHCSYPERTLLATSISFNGQMAHPELVLLGMLSSTSSAERKRAVEIIFKVRSRGPIKWDTPTGVRPFKVKSLTKKHLHEFFNTISLAARGP